MKITDFCNLGCAISLVFIIGMVYMTLAINKKEVSGKFKETLNEEQLQKYEHITSERLNIYYSGYGLGILISIAVIIYNMVIRKKKMSKLAMGCLTGGITFLTTYFYYILSKKSDYMIMHLTNEDQKREWLNVYKTMQYHYHLGLVLGIIGVSAMSLSFC